MSVHFELIISKTSDKGFSISQSDDIDEKIYISRIGALEGEGGEFPTDKFYDVIEKFYNENF